MLNHCSSVFWSFFGLSLGNAFWRQPSGRTSISRSFVWFGAGFWVGGMKGLRLFYLIYGIIYRFLPIYFLLLLLFVYFVELCSRFAKFSNAPQNVEGNFQFYVEPQKIKKRQQIIVVRVCASVCVCVYVYYQIGSWQFLCVVVAATSTSSLTPPNGGCMPRRRCAKC